MEKWSRTASLMLFFTFMFIVFIPMTSTPVLAQDISSPQITDLSTGNPEIGADYTIIVNVADDVGVSFVRLYIYYIITGGITNPEYIVMDAAGAQQYQSTISIPSNAITLRYSIYAYDTSNNPSISDVISKDVEDDQNPIAVCTALIYLGMGGNYTFNGSASTDNAGIANYTWSFPYGGTTIVRYGPSTRFRFEIAGLYNGSLTVKDGWGNSNAKAFQIRVNDTERPEADAGLQVFVMSGNVTFMDGTASLDNVGIVNYTWDFVYDGTAVKLYSASPYFIFRTAGVYEVTLTVTDAAGNTDTAFVEVQVLTSPSEGGGLPWWSYILIVMIVIIVILAIVIIRI